MMEKKVFLWHIFFSSFVSFFYWTLRYSNSLGNNSTDFFFASVVLEYSHWLPFFFDKVRLTGQVDVPVCPTFFRWWKWTKQQEEKFPIFSTLSAGDFTSHKKILPIRWWSFIVAEEKQMLCNYVVFWDEITHAIHWSEPQKFAGPPHHQLNLIKQFSKGVFGLFEHLCRHWVRIMWGKLIVKRVRVFLFCWLHPLKS